MMADALECVKVELFAAVLVPGATNAGDVRNLPQAAHVPRLLALLHSPENGQTTAGPDSTAYSAAELAPKGEMTWTS